MIESLIPVPSLVSIVAVVVLSIFDHLLSVDRYEGPITDHFNGKHFKNISNGGRLAKRIHERIGDELTILSFVFKEFRTKWRKRELPNGLAVPPSRILGGNVEVTFINHSTVLIQTEGVNVLTDPIWARRASPSFFLGSKRYMNPGVEINSLPEIDIILLTHNHYDHLDLKALKTISKRDNPVIYTPLGNSKFLKRKGVAGAVDMDWGESHKFSEIITVDCVPSQHFSARSLSDRNDVLWGGFVLRFSKGDIYFAGDTGYGPFVEHIKKIYPDGFRLGFLPIGAFKPVSFMEEVHTSPAEAIKICKELKIRKAVPIHFGTFDMAMDEQDEPEEKLKKLLTQEENSVVNFSILHNGESLMV